MFAREKALLRALFLPNTGRLRYADAAPVVCSLVVISAFLAAATVAISTRAHAAFVLCFAAHGWAVCLLACYRTDIAIHLVTLSFITLYQLYFYTTAAQRAVPWWAEFLVLGVVCALLLFENAFLYGVMRRACDRVPAEADPPDDTETIDDIHAMPVFRQYYGYVAGALLLGGCMIPLPHTGLFYLTHAHQAAMIAVWCLLAVTEAHKSLIAKDVTLPHIACKCAPLLYLHPYYWGIVGVFVVMNILLLFKRESYHLKPPRAHIHDIVQPQTLD
jgi:hypothetical protein